METKNAIKLAGTAAALAKLLGVTPSAISQWGERLPDARTWQLKVICPAWFEDEAKPDPQPTEKAA